MRKVVLWSMLIISGSFFLENLMSLSLKFSTHSAIFKLWNISNSFNSKFGIISIVVVVYFALSRNWKGLAISLALLAVTFHVPNLSVSFFNQTPALIINALITISALIYSIYYLSR